MMRLRGRLMRNVLLEWSGAVAEAHRLRAVGAAVQVSRQQSPDVARAWLPKARVVQACRQTYLTKDEDEQLSKSTWAVRL